MQGNRSFWRIVVAMTILVALIAGLCAYSVHVACFQPPPPVTRPDPGTPRGEYCAFVDSKAPWISLTLGPALLMAAVGALLRKHPRLVLAAALLIGSLLFANAIVANQQPP